MTVITYAVQFADIAAICCHPELRTPLVTLLHAIPYLSSPPRPQYCVTMALLARQNVIAKPGMRSCAMPRIAPATHMQRILVKATGEVMVDTKTAVHVLSGETFESFVSSNDTVIVDYYTDWCGPCKMIAPHYEEMAQQIPQVKFAKLNCTTDSAAKKIAMAQSVKALPTFHIFKGGERVGVFVGGKPNQLRKFVEEYV